MIYFAYFHSVMLYVIIFWGVSVESKRILLQQKRILRTMPGASSGATCRKLQTAVSFIILTYLVPVLIHILYTGCAKIKSIIIPIISRSYFHCSFLHKTPQTIHHFCMPQNSLSSLLLSRGFVKNNNIIVKICTQTVPKSLCSSKPWRCTVLTMWKSHSHRNQ